MGSGWDQDGRWRWGKAGQRKDEAEAERRRRKVVADRNRDRASRELDNTAARRLYDGGHLSPFRITIALDAKGLDGPEVDTACGAAEPDVDLWEAGALYPTWEQVEKLAALCGVTPRFLMDDESETDKLSYGRSTLRFHGLHDMSEPVWRFTPEAIRDRLRPRADV